VTEPHRLLGLLVLGLALLSAAWSAGLVALGRPGGRLFIVNLGWTVAAALLAAVVGVLRLMSGPGLADPLHLMYGALAVVVLPGFAVVAARRSRRREPVILIGTIVLLIVVVRLFQTG
jgi:hypothetical protein